MEQAQAVSMVSPVWQLWRGGQRSECAIVPTPFGVEGHYLFNGRLLASYQFDCVDRAFTWAEQRRAEMHRQGWSHRVA